MLIFNLTIIPFQFFSFVLYFNHKFAGAIRFYAAIRIFLVLNVLYAYCTLTIDMKKMHRYEWKRIKRTIRIEFFLSLLS